MGTASRLTANRGIKCRWVLWRVSTTGSVCSNVGPMVCAMKSIFDLKSSLACCRKSEPRNQSPKMDTQQTFDHREIDVMLKELPLSYTWAGPSGVTKRSLSHAPKPALGGSHEPGWLPQFDVERASWGSQ